MTSETKKEKKKCDQTLSVFGITQFAGLRFHPSYFVKSQKNENVEIRTSNIKNAGNGVFATTLLEGGKNGLYLMDYQGEPLQEWIYDAIEIKDFVFTGVTFQHPLEKDLHGIWRGIPNTLGPTINSVTSRSHDANVEFRIDYSKMNIKKSTFEGVGFVEIWIKPRKTIQPGEELLLYYSPSFWKQYTKKLQEDYCCVCLLYSSVKSNPLYLCDSCCNGFHLNCLIEQKQNQCNTKQSKTKLTQEMLSKEPWNCSNCSEPPKKKRKE